jgi:hypothetical protein
MQWLRDRDPNVHMVGGIQGLALEMNTLWGAINTNKDRLVAPCSAVA